MIRVVEAISDMNIGGAGVLLMNRIKHTDKSRFDITVLLPKGSLLCEELKKEGIKLCEINGCSDRSFDVFALFVVVRAIKRLSPDILNSHGCLNARFAGRFFGVRANIYTRHCDFPVKNIYKLKAIRTFMRILNNFLNDGIIAVSESAKRNLLLLGVDKEKITVIINGANELRKISNEEKLALRQRLNIPRDAFVVSIFARLEPYKDHVTFLKAAEILTKVGNYHFLVVGEGSAANDLKMLAKEMGIEKNVSFTGFVKDVSPLMNITDINVNCSIGTETSSLALSEGMSLGVPAVVSDYGGNVYMVNNGVNGLIFRQRDHKMLAKKIAIMVSNPTLYQELSRNAKKRFNDELNAYRMTKATEKYYYCRNCFRLHRRA